VWLVLLLLPSPHHPFPAAVAVDLNQHPWKLQGQQLHRHHVWLAAAGRPLQLPPLLLAQQQWSLLLLLLSLLLAQQQRGLPLLLAQQLWEQLLLVLLLVAI
jgi:hypothetical protein